MQLAISPFIAPMKTEHLKSMILENKQRGGVALLFFVFLSLFVFASGSAQLKDQKHVTALQLGGAAEGSRVTVFSDSPLLDYEAFRRGERFYVKIPLADFSGATPHFHADGFEDVQVQKVGDSLIVSFKLQPGATARVDQRGNRLDVVFSAPNRGSYNNTAGAGSNPQTSRDRGRDGAGPMPPDSTASRPRVVTDGAGSVNESRAPGDPRWPTNPRTNSNRNSNKNSNRTGNNEFTTRAVATASPSPFSSPSSSFSPGPSTSYQPLTTTTPALSSSSSPVASNAENSANWKDRLAPARQWMSANRLATLLGALILLSLIAYLLLALRRRQTTVVKTKRARVPKVQPRYSSEAGLNELPRAGSNEQARRGDTAQQKATKPSVVAASYQDQPWTRPDIVSPTAGHVEQVGEEEEREVFEL